MKERRNYFKRWANRLKYNPSNVRLFSFLMAFLLLAFPILTTCGGEGGDGSQITGDTNVIITVVKGADNRENPIISFAFDRVTGETVAALGEIDSLGNVVRINTLLYISENGDPIFVSVNSDGLPVLISDPSQILIEIDNYTDSSFDITFFSDGVPTEGPITVNVDPATLTQIQELFNSISLGSININLKDQVETFAFTLTENQKALGKYMGLTLSSLGCALSFITLPTGLFGHALVVAACGSPLLVASCLESDDPRCDLVSSLISAALCPTILLAPFLPPPANVGVGAAAVVACVDTLRTVVLFVSENPIPPAQPPKDLFPDRPTCEGSCGKVFERCSCDALCVELEATGGCCEGFDPACVEPPAIAPIATPTPTPTPTPTTPPAGSCVGLCGELGPGDCFCDNICVNNNDCCLDFEEVCPDCGDGKCSGTEDVTSCDIDCSVCGDGMCTGEENTTTNCPSDCVLIATLDWMVSGSASGGNPPISVACSGSFTLPLAGGTVNTTCGPSDVTFTVSAPGGLFEVSGFGNGTFDGVICTGGASGSGVITEGTMSKFFAKGTIKGTATCNGQVIPITGAFSATAN